MRGLALVVAMLAGGAWMTGAQARVVDQAADGFTVENSQWVSSDPDTSWKALVDDVDKWWPADHT